MKFTPPVIAGIVVAIVLAYLIYNEWRKKRIAEEKAKIMADIANSAPVVTTPPMSTAGNTLQSLNLDMGKPISTGNQFIIT